MTPAYYNEIDPFAAAWLRSLIAAGHIAPGDVDERSITDVSPDDLVGYGQCHFFAGIGGWSLALRLAGVPDDEPIWTGSCPCQPFSVAGKGAGTADARHLWPELRRLIAERRPSSVFGEQVASGPGRSWLAAVRADLEALGYGVGAADLCAAGVGAPHIRQRLWWGAVGLADAHRQRCGRFHALLREDTTGRDTRATFKATGRSAVGGLADAGRIGVRSEGPGTAGGSTRGVQGADGERQRLRVDVGAGGAAAGGLGGPHDPRSQGRSGGRDGADELSVGAPGVGCEGGRPPHVDWRDADWLGCRDGRWRPVEPSSCVLAHGLPARMGRHRADGDAAPAWASLTREGRQARRVIVSQIGRAAARVLFSPLERASINRVGRLRGYGNAIVPEVAAAFVTAFLECAA